MLFNRLNGKCQLILVLAMHVCLGAGSLSHATIIYESATLGPTGQSGLGIAAGYYHSSGLDAYAGSRFHVNQDEVAQVTAIGGHFFGGDTGTVFGAIVLLSGPDAFPTTVPFNSSEVIASTVFTPDSPSDDYRIPLSVTLDAGDYALIFGSSTLGASGGNLAMPVSGQSWLPGGNLIIAGTNFGWSSFDERARFVVEGVIVPEPSTLLLLALGMVMVKRKR